MSVDGKVQIKMRTSVGTLRSQAIVWVEPDRAAQLVDRRFADYLAEPQPVSIVEAVTSVAAEMKAAHKMDTEGGPADGPKSDKSPGKTRPRQRAGDSNGGSDPAGRLDKPADGKPS